MLETRLKRYISNLTVAHIINDIEFSSENKKKIKYYFLKALRNYCKIRLDLLNNNKVTEIEHKILISAIKTGIKYVVVQTGITISPTEVDRLVDELAPKILDDIHNLRIDLFTKLIG